MRLYRSIIIVCFCCLVWPLKATHQKAAEITFTYISGYTYKIKLVTYTFTESEADRPELPIAWGDGAHEVLQRDSESIVAEIQTKINIYYGTHTYAGPGQYYISIEDPNRNGGVVNMPNSINTPMYVETLLVISPFLSGGNNSPILLNRPIDDKACLGRMFMHNPGAYDADGDRLSYKLVECKTTNGEPIVGYTFPAATDTFYVNETSGDLVWNAPIAQGEYNVALLVQEWRGQRQISEITRDMQIVVQACDNWPPDIFCEDRYCVEAGSTVEFEIHALDGDGDQVKITANSEVFDTRQNASLVPGYIGVDSSSYKFRWTTALASSRKQPYVVYFKATDNGNPNLSDLKTTHIQVLAPSIKNLQASYDISNSKASLNWQKSVSPHAKGYKVYRKKGRSDLAIDSCAGGLSADYICISTIENIIDTSYIDKDSLTPGMQYCYRVCSYFADGEESFPSQETCIDVGSYVPIFTQVSVNKTDMYEGEMNLSWRRILPADSNTSKYRYVLKKGHTPELLRIHGYYPADSIVSITDTNLNTNNHPYYYSVGLLAIDEIDTNKILFPSPTTSSVYLMSIPHSRRVTLNWSYIQPWENQKFIVYRQNSNSTEFEAIAQVKDFTFDDVGLENDEVYNYYVEAYGSYHSELVPGTLINLSNTVSVTPVSSEPCKPFVFVADSSCQPLSNTIVWSFDSLYIPDIRTERANRANKSNKSNPNSLNISDKEIDLEDCYTDVRYYAIYYKRFSDPAFEEIATTTDSYYVHDDPKGYFSCYRVSSFDKNDTESELSQALCVDNRACFYYKLPNVFTPNNDGTNDTFKAYPNQYVDGFKITIFNRWGGKVYSSTDPLFEWNGRTNGSGEDCSEGVYFYAVEFTSLAEGLVDAKYQSGSVTILR